MRELSALLLLIAEIETRIRYGHIELPELFAELSQKPEFSELLFLQSGEQELFGNVPARLSRQVQLTAPSMHLAGEDRRLLLNFLQSLGATDLSGQMDHCRMHAELLGRQLEAARKDYGEKNRLYVSLGLFGGLALSMLLI